jgi:hypothetical protein
MAILISVKYSNYKFNATMSDTFRESYFRGSESSQATTQGDYVNDSYDSVVPELNAAYKALRKWVDTTELEQGKYPVKVWHLEYIGEDYKGVGIVKAKPVYEEA